MSCETTPKKRKMLSSFSIIFILLFIVAIITIICNGASVSNQYGEGQIVAATLGQIVILIRVERKLFLSVYIHLVCKYLDTNVLFP